MLGLYVIFHVKIGRHTTDFICLTADRAELPPLESIYVRERPAAGAPDNNVHGNVVIRIPMINIYRRF
jgi:hypothetical protein